MKTIAQVEKNESRWFDGFCYAGLLPSIAWLHSFQSKLLHEQREKHPQGRLLSVGVGCGTELEILIGQGNDSMWTGIDTIDISCESTDILEKMDRKHPQNTDIEHLVIDIADIADHEHYGEWSVIQCGFILHDVPYERKDDVFALLYSGLCPGGRLLISDMFLDNRPKPGVSDVFRQNKVAALYDQFLHEIEQCQRNGILSNTAAMALRGDGNLAGVLAVKREAVSGIRDFLEDRQQTENRLVKSGFCNIRFYVNPEHDALGVISAFRSASSACGISGIKGEEQLHV